jgi:hypothetical protein
MISTRRILHDCATIVRILLGFETRTNRECVVQLRPRILIPGNKESHPPLACDPVVDPLANLALDDAVAHVAELLAASKAIP